MYLSVFISILHLVLFYFHTVVGIVDTDFKHPASLIKCSNQTRCLQPKLDLQVRYSVYFCSHKNHGVRFYYQAREGLLQHPMIDLVESMQDADFIVYLPVSADWDVSECNSIAYANKTVIIDEGDYPQLFIPDNAQQIRKAHPELEAKKSFYYMYFKRSCVHRSNGKNGGYMQYFATHSNVFPMTYTIMDGYVRNTFPMMNERDYQLVCTLRGGERDPARKRIKEWVKEYADDRKLKKYVAGEVDVTFCVVVS